MKKILIVEDELIVRSIYRRKFEISGYQVETAEEGNTALKLLPTFKPDVAQIDIGLPGMDGVEVIRQIRAMPEFKNLPILVISSFYRPDLAKDAWKAGASKCVSKMDCTPNLALELVEQMLSGENVGFNPSPSLNMVAMPQEAIKVIPAESPFQEVTQIFSRKPMPSAGVPMSTPSAPPSIIPVKPNTTLPNLGREKPAPPQAPPEPPPDPTFGPAVIPASESITQIFTRPDPGATMRFKKDAGAPAQQQPPPPAQPPPSSGQTIQFNRGDFGGTRQFAKPDPGGTRITTRPHFAAPTAQKLVVSTPPAAPAAPAPVAPAEPATPAASSPWVQPIIPEGAGGNTAFRLEIRQEFLRRAPQIQNDLRDRVGALVKSKSTTDQIDLLRDLENSVASLASLSGITGFSRISHLAGAMDALIKDLHKKPSQMTNSVLRSIAHASDCLNNLFRDLERTPREIPQSMLILAVDDEPIARRTISVALGKADLRCIGMEDSKMALSILKENTFDLIFLDAEMPGLSGFELCAEVRKLSTNKTTPVIFVTSLTKFEVRAQSSLSGGNDLIAKPFLMMELAVKALTYLLKPQPTVEAKAAAP